MQARLTDEYVERATFRGGNVDARFDTHPDSPGGFGVRIHPSGTKTFFIKYTYAVGRRKQETLGYFVDMGVAEARAAGGGFTCALPNERQHPIHDQRTQPADCEPHRHLGRQSSRE